jgi:putative Mn2+ efflux pump MntP
MDKIYAPVILGFIVGVDNLRVGLCLGGLNLSKASQMKFAFSFALFESVMPLIGLVVGDLLVPWVGDWAAYLGPLSLGGCGAYMIYHATNKEKFAPDVLDAKWFLWGLPFSLSFDNLFAGVGLGLLDFEVLTSSIIIGLISGTLSFAGIKLGSLVNKYLPSKAEFVGGISMLLLAIYSLFYN